MPHWGYFFYSTERVWANRWALLPLCLESVMEKKKSLGTLVGVSLVAAAFVAAVTYGTQAVCRTVGNGDPFWILFGVVVWGGIAASLWLVGTLMWENEI